jgi:hypothetical protein
MTTLVVAIDFGTHASGFAYASALEAANPAPVPVMTIYRDWPGGHAFHYFKTRTALLRSASGQVLAWGNEAILEYRHQQRHGAAAPLQLRDNFKLELTSRDRTLRERAIEDATDYLRLLREQALTVIRSYAMDVPAEEIRWCMTMPVTSAQGLVGFDAVLRNQVAGPAGFPATDRQAFMLLAEPEAAAIYCQLEGTAPGERFTVIDAGGGTVDITTLEVDKDSRLRQIGFHGGGKLGSRFLNAKFREMLLGRLALQPGWSENADPRSEDWATIMTNWEDDKRSWDFAKASTYRVRIPRRADPDADFGADVRPPACDSELQLASKDILNEVFEPLVSDILGQLDKAMANLPDGPQVDQVLLVGGFGGSPYLQRRLNDHLAGRASLVTFEDPMSAESVLRGAVRYALDPGSIRARRMQYTYGCDILSSCKRPDQEHRTEHRWIRFTRWGEKHERCLQLRTFASRGEVIEAGTKKPAVPLYPADCTQRSVTFRLYATASPDPYFTEDCELLGAVELPMKIPFWRSVHWRPIDIQVTLGETELVFCAGDRRRPKDYREIRLRYLGEDADGGRADDGS